MPEKRNTPEEKAHAVLLNLQDNVPVNEICIRFGITPTCFYQWRNYFLASAKSVFEGTGRKEQREHAKAVQNYQASIQRKNAVIAGLVEECTRLKKEFGEP